MLERIGQLISKAREGAGFSREQLAREAGISADTVEGLERGAPGVTTTQLVSLAHALSLDPLALLNGREDEQPRPSVFLRHAPAQDFDDRDYAVLDEALEAGRTLVRLRRLLGRGPLGAHAGGFVPRAASADTPDSPARDGYTLARQVRRWLELPDGPLEDVRRLVEERFGVVVVVRDFVSNKVTAAAVRSGAAAAVALSATDPWRASNPLLARVNLTHELCHLLFDPPVGGLQLVVDAQVDRKANAAEQRARGFAAEMLLPLAGVTALLGQPLQVSQPETAAALVVRARSHFATPHELTANHLCNLGFVHKDLRAWLEAEKTAFNGVVPPTTLPRASEPSLLLREHVEAGHQEGVLTDGEARSILGLDRLAPLPWEPPSP